MSTVPASSWAVAPFTDADVQAWEQLASPLERPFASALMVAVLTAFNQAEQAGYVIRRALHPPSPLAGGIQDAAPDAHWPGRYRTIQMIRESLIKIAPICGFPRVINGLNQCVAIVDEPTLEALSKEASREITSIEQLQLVRQRGESFFNQIYDRHTDRVMQMLHRASPDLADMIKDVYGKVLSDTRLLSAVETELLLVGALQAVDTPIQQRSHIRGAQNLGATLEQIHAVTSLVHAIAKPLQLSAHKA